MANLICRVKNQGAFPREGVRAAGQLVCLTADEALVSLFLGLIEYPNGLPAEMLERAREKVVDQYNLPTFARNRR